MSYVLKSCYGENIRQFIDLKNRLGYKIKSQTWYLREVDSAALSFKCNTPGITIGFAEHFSQLKENETLENRYNRVRALKVFSIFLNDLGIDSYVPETPRYVENLFTPYIYSEAQLKAILQFVDNLIVPSSTEKSSRTFVFPSLIRLLISTGVRVGEATNLKVDNINFNEKTIKIENSKNGKDRLLPITDSMCEVLAEQKRSRDLFCRNGSKSKFLFVDIEGQQVDSQCLSYDFPKILDSAGLKFKGRSKSPRVHDFRHTFAVRALDKMVASGMDPNNMLPVLAAYLGHTTIESSQRYLRLSAYAYPYFTDQLEELASQIFPR